MKHLSIVESKKIFGGSDCESSYDSFKNDLEDVLQSAANTVEDTANSLAAQIKELLDKYK